MLIVAEPALNVAEVAAPPTTNVPVKFFVPEPALNVPPVSRPVLPVTV